MAVVDFHNHYYPPKYMQALQSGQSSIKVTIDSEGNPLLHYPGDYNVVVRGHRDLAYRQEVLDDHGVTMQVVTLTTPGTHVETAGNAATLASMVNDEFREAIDTLGIDRCHLVVHDIGGPIACEWAVRNPERVLSLTALNTMLGVAGFKRPWSMQPFAIRGVGKLWLGALRPLPMSQLLYLQAIDNRAATPTVSRSATRSP